MYSEILAWIDWNLVGCAAVLFSMGVIVGPKVVERNVTFLTAYPLWISEWLEKVLQRKPGFARLFLLIFCFNATSLFASFVSGFAGILPFLFAFWTGLNVAVITFTVAGRLGLATVFLNPVALFELPAAWIALAVGMTLGLEVVSPMLGVRLAALFGRLVGVYLFVVLPLLLVAGLIEAAMIFFTLRHNSD